MNTRQTEKYQLPAEIRDSVASELGDSVPEVQAIFAGARDYGVLHVWAVVPEHDRAVYRKIYAKEKHIIHQFEGVDFDFSIVPSHGRDPGTLISDPEIQLAFIRK
jgi:hypothetical protein